MSEEANDIYVRELAKRLASDFTGKNMSSKSYAALLASQENLPRSGSQSVNSSTYYLRAGGNKGQTTLQPINENIPNRNEFQQNHKNSFELNPKLALANPIIGPSSAKNFAESDFQENSDKFANDDSYTQAGPPSFSKSGYPVQSKKGGGYEYRSFGKIANDTNRGDLSSQRNVDLSSKRTKRGKDQTPEVKECELAKTIQESLKFVTKCKVHGQQYSLFNPTSKALCCIECIYSNSKTTSKKAQVLSIKSAYPIICETNKIYKTESKEKVMILEENIRACNQNIGIIQDSQENLITQIRKEFNDVFEELKRREAFLLDQVASVADTEITKQKYKIDELEFLRNCFKDARDVDPTQSMELGVHFFGVYNLLKSYIKPFEIAGALMTPDEFSSLDFGTRNLLKSEISNFGKFLNPKSPQKKILSKSKSTVSKPRSESAQKNVAPDRSMSPIRTPATNTLINPKRAITPEKVKEVPSLKNLKSPPTTNLERDTIKKATKLKGSKSSGKLSTAEILTYNRQEENIPTLFPEPKEQNFAHEVNVSSTKAARITEFDLSEYAEKSDSPPREKRLAGVEESANVKTLARANEDFRREFGKVNESDISKERISEPTINKSVELINNLFLFHDSHVISSELRNNDFYTMLPQHIKYTKLVYRMSQDGASSAAFHEKCDHQPNMVVLVKCNSRYVFGYYLPISLVSEEKYNTCEDVFIFSLSNPLLDKPTKFPVKSDKKFISLYQSSKSPCLGSTLQNKQDLWIQFDNLSNSCSNIGYAYKLPAGIDGTKALAGQYTGWDVEEIEVYKLFL